MDTKKILVGAASLAMLGTIAVTGPAAAAAGNGFPPIKASGYAPSAEDIGTCNNVWATIDMTKNYKLTRLSDTTYNLEVKESGPLTTIAGSSPGACESGANNGNTVAAGITGSTHQTFNATVTAWTPPTTNPDCSTACSSSGGFLTAVFGATWTRGDFSWTSFYEAGSNGTWFDTDVNWPFNDRGDITGP
jgi:hypothetical protein